MSLQTLLTLARRIWDAGSAGNSDLHSALESLIRAQAVNQSESRATREALVRLEKHIQRSGKEQFKANALAESLLQQARLADAAQKRESEELRRRLVEAESLARRQIIARLLPVVDGLEEALASAERVLQLQPGTFWLWPGLGRTKERQARAAWVEGVRLLHSRVLDILAAEDVRPMLTVGQAFDPRKHVAVEKVAAAMGHEAGRIVRETRRGYTVGDAVLRYAEVVVAA